MLKPRVSSTNSGYAKEDDEERGGKNVHVAYRESEGKRLSHGGNPKRLEKTKSLNLLKV